MSISSSTEEARQQMRAATGEHTGIGAAIPVQRPSATTTGFADAAGLPWVLAMVLALAILWGLLRALKRRAADSAAPSGWIARLPPIFRAGEGRAIRPTCSVRLTPQHSVHALDWNGRSILVGCTAQTFVVLGDVAAPPSPPADKTA